MIDVEYTKKLIMDFNRNHYKFSNKTFNKIFNVFAIIIAIFDVIIVIAGLYDLFTLKMILWQFLIVACIVLLNTNIFPDILTRSFLKSDKLSNGLNSKMTFHKDKVIVCNEIETMKLEYIKLYKVMETKDYIYLYINKQQAVIVNKNSTAEENISKLIGMLRVSVNNYTKFVK